MPNYQRAANRLFKSKSEQQSLDHSTNSLKISATRGELLIEIQTPQKSKISQDFLSSQRFKQQQQAQNRYYAIRAQVMKGEREVERKNPLFYTFDKSPVNPNFKTLDSPLRKSTKEIVMKQLEEENMKIKEETLNELALSITSSQALSMMNGSQFKQNIRYEHQKIPVNKELWKTSLQHDQERVKKYQKLADEGKW